jgi:hypothetical protein
MGYIKEGDAKIKGKITPMDNTQINEGNIRFVI